MGFGLVDEIKQMGRRAVKKRMVIASVVSNNERGVL